MSDESWTKRFRETVSDFIDWICSNSMADDDCDYVSTGKYDPVDIKINLSIKIRQK